MPQQRLQVAHIARVASELQGVDGGYDDVGIRILQGIDQPLNRSETFSLLQTRERGDSNDRIGIVSGERR